MNGYREALYKLELHPIVEASDCDEARDVLSALLVAGAELDWPSHVNRGLYATLKACSQSKKDFAEGISERISLLWNTIYS